MFQKKLIREGSLFEDELFHRIDPGNHISYVV
jgi:hypothetical protein